MDFRKSFIRFLAVTVILSLTMSVPACASPKSAMDMSIEDVMRQTTQLYGCKWQGSVCFIKQTEGQISLASASTSNNLLETIQINALVACTRTNCPQKVTTSRDAVLKLVKYLLPSWTNSVAWFDKALNDAKLPHGSNQIKLGDVIILVQWLQPADIEGTYAQIFITKNPAVLDEWKLKDD